MVRERRASGEGDLVKVVGVGASENAGMSSENGVRTSITECLRFPTEGQSASG